MVKPGHDSVLQALEVLDGPEHFLPPLKACWMILREPICVSLPHVLSHDGQVHLPHLQFTGRGGGGRGGFGGSQADAILCPYVQPNDVSKILFGSTRLCE